MKKRFIDIHENVIKTYRDEYYKNITFYSAHSGQTYPVVTFLLPLTIVLFYLINSNLGLLAYFIAIVLLILFNLIIYVFVTSRSVRNKYLDIVRKYGHRSIDDYELLVEKYITGPDAFYHNLLLDYIEKYDLSSSTDRIVSVKNEEYYIWMGSNKDKICLLGTHSNVKPELINIKIDDIRYYRHNDLKHMVVLKTKDSIFCFKEEYMKLFDKMISSKKYKSRKDIDLQEYIGDYESSLRKLNKELDVKFNNRKLKFEKNLRKFIYLLIALFSFVILSLIIPTISGITHLFNYVLIIELNLSLFRMFYYIPKTENVVKNEKLRYLQRERRYKDMFYELRSILDIDDDFQIIYDKSGMEYVVWIRNGYFHLFLNEMIFNSVYMSVKVKDVSYCNKEDGLISLKLKNKNYDFKDSSIKGLSEIMSDNHYKR